MFSWLVDSVWKCQVVCEFIVLDKLDCCAPIIKKNAETRGVSLRVQVNSGVF